MRELLLKVGTVKESLNEIYDVPGIYETTVPRSIFQLSVLTIAGGGGGSSGRRTNNVNYGGHGGSGGGLSWRTFPVSPGDKITIVVGAGGEGSAGANYSLGKDGEDSLVYINDELMVHAKGGLGGSSPGAAASPGGLGGPALNPLYGGGSGGNGGRITAEWIACKGGGAGGYNGDGGDSASRVGTTVTPGGTGQGGAGGGGGYNTADYAGGTEIYGEGESGKMGFQGSSLIPDTKSGLYGAGGAGANRPTNPPGNQSGYAGSQGVVRILMGPDRYFPSTNTGPT